MRTWDEIEDLQTKRSQWKCSLTYLLYSRWDTAEFDLLVRVIHEEYYCTHVRNLLGKGKREILLYTCRLHYTSYTRGIVQYTSTLPFRSCTWGILLTYCTYARYLSGVVHGVFHCPHWTNWQDSWRSPSSFCGRSFEQVWRLVSIVSKYVDNLSWHLLTNHG